MSDAVEGDRDPPADGDTEDADPAPEQDAEGGDVGDLPDIEDDERADIDLSDIDTEAVEQEAGAGDPGDRPDGDGVDEDDPAGGSGASAPSVSWGDKYVELLGVMLVALVEEVDEDPDTDDLGDEIEALATQPPVNLDEQVDRLLAEYGGPDEMSPQQAVLFSTGIVSVTVLAKETDLAGDLAGELLDGGQPA